MAISKARKEELLAQYTDLIENSEAIFLAEYTGMSVKAMESLRDEVYKAEGAFHVTKNTLMKRALEDSNNSVPEDLLLGQLATGFAKSEAPTLAKALVDFAKKEDSLTIKGGFLSGELLTIEQVEALAKLPTLDQLRGQIIGLISSPAQGIAGSIASGVRQLVNVLDAYAKEKEEDSAEAAA
ncbi:MAG: 50S ribosomal protein L10 [Chloroflexi bacterium]|nr:50S ribosomal protein L10 [Chloroflexota bacterium]